MKLSHLLLALLLAYAPLSRAAEAPLLTLIPDQSHLTFTGTQNHAPVTGEFTKLTTTIHFAENNLPGSSVKAEIDIASIKTPDADIAKNLQTDDWFGVTKFPQAVFESHDFTKEGDHYLAKGSLTLHGISKPTEISFTLTHEGNLLKVTGETSLKRLAYGVGSGDWKDTSVVEDGVKVKLVLVAK